MRQSSFESAGSVIAGSEVNFLAGPLLNRKTPFWPEKQVEWRGLAEAAICASDSIPFAKGSFVVSV